MRINKDVEKILFEKCNRLNRFLKIPGIYKHFKQKENNEEMLYVVTNVSIPMEAEEFDTNVTALCNGFYMMYYTELDLKIPIIRIADRYYHNKKTEKEILVMYTALYGARESYVRPLSIFLSKVDKIKHPNVTQKFRFEKVDC